MSGPIVRLVAQVVLVGVNIVTKAFMQAYQQAKAGGGSAGQAAKTVSTAGRMPLDQARQILNLDARAPLARDEIMRAFTKYYEANDAERGGSFYVQSKIWSAKEALLDDVRRTQQNQQQQQQQQAAPPADAGVRFSENANLDERSGESQQALYARHQSDAQPLNLEDVLVAFGYRGPALRAGGRVLELR